MEDEDLTVLSAKKRGACQLSASKNDPAATGRHFEFDRHALYRRARKALILDTDRVADGIAAKTVLRCRRANDLRLRVARDDADYRGGVIALQQQTVRDHLMPELQFRYADLATRTALHLQRTCR